MEDLILPTDTSSRTTDIIRTSCAIKTRNLSMIVDISMEPDKKGNSSPAGTMDTLETPDTTGSQKLIKMNPRIVTSETIGTIDAIETTKLIRIKGRAKTTALIRTINAIWITGLIRTTKTNGIIDAMEMRNGKRKS